MSGPTAKVYRKMELALKRHGIHEAGCAAVKVIGRFGSRAGLRWSEGDLSHCDCGFGAAMKEAYLGIEDTEEVDRRKARHPFWGGGK